MYKKSVFQMEPNILDVLGKPFTNELHPKPLAFKRQSVCSSS